jgi:hypothetical protein
MQAIYNTLVPNSQEAQNPIEKFTFYGIPDTPTSL